MNDYENVLCHIHSYVQMFPWYNSDWICQQDHPGHRIDTNDDGEWGRLLLGVRRPDHVRRVYVYGDRNLVYALHDYWLPGGRHRDDSVRVHHRHHTNTRCEQLISFRVRLHVTKFSPLFSTMKNELHCRKWGCWHSKHFSQYTRLNGLWAHMHWNSILLLAIIDKYVCADDWTAETAIIAGNIWYKKQYRSIFRDGGILFRVTTPLERKSRHDNLSNRTSFWDASDQYSLTN